MLLLLFMLWMVLCALVVVAACRAGAREDAMWLVEADAWREEYARVTRERERRREVGR